MNASLRTLARLGVNKRLADGRHHLSRLEALRHAAATIAAGGDPAPAGVLLELFPLEGVAAVAVLDLDDPEVGVAGEPIGARGSRVWLRFNRLGSPGSQS